MIHAIFFLSGVSALMFENIWFRQAGIVFGNGVWASSLVLSSFMAGLAIGNGFAAARPIARARALKRYALLELIVGMTGIALVLLFPAFGSSVIGLLSNQLQDSLALAITRFVLAFVLMVIPTAAMGMTLPVLVGRAPSNALFGATLGRLYGWNTLGAVVGAIVGEAWLYEILGIRGTGFVAGGLNLAAALMSATLARGTLPPSEVTPETTFTSSLTAREMRLLAVGALSGATFLALEVVWTRFLLLFVFGTALTFAVMLAVTLTGLALGGLAAAHMPRWTESPGSPPNLTLLAGTAVTASYVSLDRVLGLNMDALPGNPWTRLAMVAAALILPTAFISGALFTALGASLATTLSGGRATGLLALFNTAGAAMGSMLAGFILLPGLGMERSFELLALSYGAMALLSPGALSQIRHSRVTWGVVGVFVLFATLFPRGLMNTTYLRRALWSFTAPGSDTRVLGVREGTMETVTYVEQRFQGQSLSTRLVTNGFSMSGTMSFARRYMQAFVYLPVAIHPQVKRALLISYGVGITARALVQTAEIEKIDVVDISQEVLDLAPLAFPTSEGSPLTDPRVTTHVEDGRFFLQTTSNRYDLITSEPPPPHLGGVVNLYTREYFDLLKRRLNPGGIVSYWLPVASLSDTDAQVISSAFCEVFTDCTLWKGMNLDWILLGTRDLQTTVTSDRFAAQWSAQGPADIKVLGFEKPEHLGALYMGDAKTIPELTSLPPLTDNFPGRLTHAPPIAPPFGPWRRKLMDAKVGRESFITSPFIKLAFPPEIREATLPYFTVQKSYDDMNAYIVGEPVHEEIDEAVTFIRTFGLTVLPAIQIGSSADMQILVNRLESQGGIDAAWYYAHLGIQEIAASKYEEGVGHLRKASAVDPAFPGIEERVALGLCLAGRRSEAATARATVRAPLSDSWNAALDRACSVS
ncbi:MAG: spermidine synthase [Vicinamibacteria bacterium]